MAKTLQDFTEFMKNNSLPLCQIPEEYRGYLDTYKNAKDTWLVMSADGTFVPTLSMGSSARGISRLRPEVVLPEGNKPNSYTVPVTKSGYINTAGSKYISWLKKDDVMLALGDSAPVMFGGWRYTNGAKERISSRECGLTARGDITENAALWVTPLIPTEMIVWKMTNVAAPIQPTLVETAELKRTPKPEALTPGTTYPDTYVGRSAD